MKVWQLLILEFASLIKLLTHQKFEISAVHWLIISLMKMSDECGIDHLLLPGSLCPNEFDKGGPDLVNVAKLLLHVP